MARFTLWTNWDGSSGPSIRADGVRSGAAAVFLGLVAGCASTGDEAARPPCEPVEPAAVTGVDPETLAGTWHLMLVATSGRMEGEESEVRLVLRPQEPALREVPGVGGEPIPGTRQALVGTLSDDLDQVGAWVPGDVGSEDPEAPGVSLLVTEPDVAGAGRPGILLRLGSEANVRGRIAYDDAYTVLRVHRVSEEALYGRWESGVRTEQAGGHFCAVR